MILCRIARKLLAWRWWIYEATEWKLPGLNVENLNLQWKIIFLCFRLSLKQPQDKLEFLILHLTTFTFYRMVNVSKQMKRKRYKKWKIALTSLQLSLSNPVLTDVLKITKEVCRWTPTIRLIAAVHKNAILNYHAALILLVDEAVLFFCYLMNLSGKCVFADVCFNELSVSNASTLTEKYVKF